MTSRRHLVFACGAGLLIAFAGARAQPARLRTYRVGLLGAETAQRTQSDLELLRKGLHELGYVDASQLVYEVRSAEGNYDRLIDLARELVALRVDVLVTSGSKAGMAAKHATASVPIVVSNMGDAVLAGFTGSLARPGRNITGVSLLNPEVTARQLELLREIKPALDRVAVLMNPANPNYELTLTALRRAAQGVRITVANFDAKRSAEIEPAIRSARNAGLRAMIVQSETLFAAEAPAVATLATRHGIATAGIASFARAGGLIGYSAASSERWRQVAIYVDRILRGAKPSELPIAQPSKFELVINLRSARALELTMPPSLLVRADEIVQ